MVMLVRFDFSFFFFFFFSCLSDGSSFSSSLPSPPQKDAQCASKTCLVLNTGEYGTCSPPKHKKIPGEEEEGRWWGEEDEDSVGGGACKATWQCDEIQFCSLEGFCTSSLVFYFYFYFILFFFVGFVGFVVFVVFCYCFCIFNNTHKQQQKTTKK